MKKSNDSNAMKPDDFEKQLQQQPMRSLPAEWRAEILQAAQVASGSRPSALGSRPKSWVHQLFWPCPQAWAGLAAVWLVIFAVNSASTTKTETVAKSALPTSPETIVALMVTKEQKRELAKLIEPFESQPAEPPKPTLPQPRSECPLTAVIV
jgi:hypothetical protein